MSKKFKAIKLIRTSKYAVRRGVMAAIVALVVGWVGVTRLPHASAADVDDALVQDAREAWRVRDKVRLLAARNALLEAHHPLAPWVDYWWVSSRLTELGRSEADDFLARWADTYVADRFRNDWLLELGHRGDWATFLRIQPTFRMNDDREVVCWGILARQQTGAMMEGPGDWQEQARQAWWGQREPDRGCHAMAQALFAAGILTPDDVWRKLRLAVELDRPAVVQQSARLLGDVVSDAIGRLMSQPRDFLMPEGRKGSAGEFKSTARMPPGATIGPTSRSGKKTHGKTRGKAARAHLHLAPIPLAIPPEAQGPLNLLAFIRWANMDPDAAAEALRDPNARVRWKWTADDSAWAWAQVGRAHAWRLSSDAPSDFERGLADRALANVNSVTLAPKIWAQWSPETLAWMARAGIRAATSGDKARWVLVETAIDAMSPDQMTDPAWTYWKARALLARAGSAANDPVRAQAREWLARIASPLHFYGQLAAEELRGQPIKSPNPPSPPTDAELSQARAWPGIDRALRLFALGWRGEAVREWNFAVGYARAGGLTDRELLAIAEVACAQEIWDRCINTSDKTRVEINLAQRFPMPFKDDVLSAARDVGLDPAYMYGLMRQESRFIVAAKSNVGASGLMQIMPGTAAWTARKLGIPYHRDQITERSTNLRIGAGYLKLVLDDLGGSQAMAAAAYNAGPGRPRRWREGASLDAAAWVENIPFNETRDYVKKVLGNAVVYAQLIEGVPMSARKRLGAKIGPRAASAPPPEADLP
ncbi:MAG: lytic transglycosylase domain-containing protein [Burkholderiales bacterium]|nr:lytic transglycosylase domain-containing protein [Burkholderiales bacterium]